MSIELRTIIDFGKERNSKTCILSNSNLSKMHLSDFFSTLPFVFCGITNTCNYASRNDFTYWLSGDVRQPMMPVSNTAIEPFISRCAVCKTPDHSIAVHSQDLVTPPCPLGYESLWSGYSFLMVRFSIIFFV